MVKVSMEVRSGTARFRVTVQAESMQRALGLVAGRYPTRICRVAFPIEVEDPTAESLAVRAEPQPETLAA
jgi:hypothetical protein